MKAGTRNQTRRRVQQNPDEEVDMGIEWRTDTDVALEEGKTEGRPELLDFSAAPM
jgi:hypothetical protein